MCECVHIEYYACNLLVVRKNWFVEWRQNQESSLPTNWTAYNFFFSSVWTIGISPPCSEMNTKRKKERKTKNVLYDEEILKSFRYSMEKRPLHWHIQFGWSSSTELKTWRCAWKRWGKISLLQSRLSFRGFRWSSLSFASIPQCVNSTRWVSISLYVCVLCGARRSLVQLACMWRTCTCMWQMRQWKLPSIKSYTYITTLSHTHTDRHWPVQLLKAL